MNFPGLSVLVVDDERAIRRYLCTSLIALGCVVLEAANGKEAIQQAALKRPDLVILDLGLPDLDGIEVTRRLREWTTIPIIILSVREQESDKIAALDAGADDYLTKPFGTGELLARIRAALRRSEQPSIDPIIRVRELEIDLAHRRVHIGGEDVTLTPTEFDILRLLAQNIGKVLTHRQLLQAVWGQPYSDDLHLLRVNISNLRRKIEPDVSRPYYILTEAGVGYRLRSES